jgi:hypothetical protein
MKKNESSLMGDLIAVKKKDESIEKPRSLLSSAIFECVID